MNAQTRWVILAAAVLVQVALLAVVVRPQLMARFTGTEYRLAVGPVDPIDPFRGAYVDLEYPGLPPYADMAGSGEEFIPLVKKGRLWEGKRPVRQRPARGPYIACVDGGCGIDSLFLPQDEAQRTERELAKDRMAAVVKIDDEGNAAAVRLAPR